jgi:hypothetical protein
VPVLSCMDAAAGLCTPVSHQHMLNED